MWPLEIRRILGIPAMYSAFSNAVGGDARKIYAQEYIHAARGARILDIGCGTADILDHLPTDVEYVGFDVSERYIESAKKRFGARGTFFCANVASQAGKTLTDFDIVLGNGVLHHLDDREAVDLFRIAHRALKVGGRFISLDGCYVEGQSPIARYLLSRDRGSHVRTAPAYERLAGKIFPNVRSDIRHDLMRIPYTHIIMECLQSHTQP